MKKPTMLVRTLFLALAAAVALPAFADPVPPNSMRTDDNHPGSKHRMKGLARGTPVSFYPTHNGQRIKNADGSEVRQTGRASPEVGANFPGIINGQGVNDTETVVGVPADPLDPGIMRVAAFAGGLMTPSIGAWLRDNGYTDGVEMQLPQFLRSGFPIVYYGVDLAAVGPGGAAFATANPVGVILPCGLGGTLPGLPGYTFSLTPPVYAPGIGWMVTPLAAGTPLQFVGTDFLSADSSPCPADLNGDGLVDFSDYLDFLTLYDTIDPRADFNGDGFIDFADYLEFLNHYDTAC